MIKIHLRDAENRRKLNSSLKWKLFIRSCELMAHQPRIISLYRTINSIPFFKDVIGASIKKESSIAAESGLDTLGNGANNPFIETYEKKIPRATISFFNRSPGGMGRREVDNTPNLFTHCTTLSHSKLW